MYVSQQDLRTQEHSLDVNFICLRVLFLILLVVVGLCNGKTVKLIQIMIAIERTYPPLGPLKSSGAFTNEISLALAMTNRGLICTGAQGLDHSTFR